LTANLKEVEKKNCGNGSTEKPDRPLLMTIDIAILYSQPLVEVKDGRRSGLSLYQSRYNQADFNSVKNTLHSAVDSLAIDF